MPGGLAAARRRLGIFPDCVFEPATPRVADWLHAIDIFVLPSLSEALSNSLMEAMACGCCVAASRVGGNPELVAHGETGMLFEPRDTRPDWLKYCVCSARSDGARGRLACNAAASIHSRFSLVRPRAEWVRFIRRYWLEPGGSTTAPAAHLPG